MVSPSLQSLADLCGIRIAYLMWTRRYVTKRCLTQVLFDELVDVVLDDVKNLHLPDKLKSRISKHVRPTGKHLLSIIRLWISNDLHESATNWLTSDILFECLILNADGLINQRKTAEKILSNRKLHNVNAFRFSCINFLENRVLALWIQVREYFLSKIILEGEQANAFIAQNGYTGVLGTYVDLTDTYYSSFVREYPLMEIESAIEPFPFTTEPEEVLFWIGFCLSKDNGHNIEDVPHFLGDEVGWFEFSLEFAAFSCNVACFDYLKNCCNVEYEYVKFIKKLFSSKEKDRIQPGFVFHFLLLNSEEKAELFQKRGDETLAQFLQWPLTLTFLEKPAELWNLLHGIQKMTAFTEIFYTIFNENIPWHSLRHGDNCQFHLNCFPFVPRMHCLDHLRKLFVSLCEIISEEYKSLFLVDYLLLSIEKWQGQPVFCSNFIRSGLKEKLYELFLANGEAILELFERDDMKESLRSVVVKHKPQHFQELDNRCISFVETQTVRPEIIKKEIVRVRGRSLITQEGRKRRRNFAFSIHEQFLIFIKKHTFFESS